MNEQEKEVLARIFLHAMGPIESFRLPDEELLLLLESDQYESFSPEFRHWLENQLDEVCVEQGQ